MWATHLLQLIPSFQDVSNQDTINTIHIIIAAHIWMQLYMIPMYHVYLIVYNSSHPVRVAAVASLMSDLEVLLPTNLLVEYLQVRVEIHSMNVLE
jgi:hypothetical protein